MNQHRHTIHDTLTSWGSEQRQSPLSNEELKNKTLTRFRSMPFKETSPSAWRAPWLTFALASLAVISLFINFTPVMRYIPTPISPIFVGDGVIRKMSAESVYQGQRDSLYYKKPGSDISITDKREFLKTDYDATINTRDVQEMTQRIQIMVRGFDGRVDSSGNSKQWGFVSFVLPANKFEAFRAEVRSLTGSRFLIETTSTENLLPQKQSIEQQQQEVQNTLAQLGADKERLNVSHQQTAASVNSKINKVNDDLEVLKIRADVTSDPELRKEIKAEEEKLLSRKLALQAELINENTSYTKNLNVLNLQIKDTETMLDNVIGQDKKLIDTVATVRGIISLNWINLWEVIRLYLPINLAFIFFTAGAVIAHTIYRRRSYIYLP